MLLTRDNSRSAVYCACLSRKKPWVSLLCLQSALVPGSTAHLQLPCIIVCGVLEQWSKPHTHYLNLNTVHDSPYQLLQLSA